MISVRVIGEGPAVLLVHGDVGPGPTWKAQEPLRARWRLVILARRGFRPSPPTTTQDPAIDARDIEKLLAREPAHCVGYSTGAEGLALAAGNAPDRVRSLTLVEPPSLDGADLDAVAAAGVPTLVITGAPDPGADATAEALAATLGARRERMPDAGRAPMRAPGFNGVLERFLFAAERL